MASHRSLLTPFDNQRCTGHHHHASLCNKELAKAAQYTPKMQSLFVEAVQISHDTFAVKRGPSHDNPHTSPVLVTNARGFDFDDLAIFRHPDGRIVQPPAVGGVLSVLTTSTCAPHHTAETLNTVGGTT
eukprot:3864466-Pyramimonas_sp.AAC.1